MGTRSRLCGLLVAALWLGACDPGVQLGTVCERNSDCAPPLVCGLGRCRTECRVNRDCPLGATCLEIEGGSVCSLEQDRCGSSDDCAAPLRCVASECRQSCASDTDCVEDGECRSLSGGAESVCVDPRVAPDGGPSDGGSLDGGAGDAGQSCQGCVADVAIGLSTTCAVTTGGAIWCWGSDANQLLGDGTGAHGGGCATDCSLEPVRVRSAAGPLEGAREVACGEGHCCALLDTTEVWCWGRQYRGQLGNTAAHGDVAAPVIRDFEPLTGARGLAVGWNHSCALVDPGGELVCWGENAHGELGDGTTTPADTARPVSVISGARAPALDFQFTCAIDVGGTVSCWGVNQRGVMGGATLGGESLTPVAIAGTGGATMIATGDDYACAIVGGGVRCWGDGRTGQLGVPVPVPQDCGTGFEGQCSLTPVDVALPAGTTAIAIGGAPTSRTTCAVLLDGRAFCWGNNEMAQTGEAGPSAQFVPVPLRDLDGTTLLRGGRAIVVGNHGCVILESGELRCWGSNSHGQLGLGTFDDAADHAIPRPVVLPP